MPGSGFNLARIQEEVRSDKPETRGLAMQELVLQARKNPAVQAPALQIFRTCLETTQDDWPTATAIRGIEEIAGPEEARKVRLSLFNHPRATLVAVIVLAIRRHLLRCRWPHRT
jgi:hypothetical protein